MASRRFSGSRGSSGLRHELLDLANHLRQERLFVQSEKVQLQELNEQVKSSSERLSHTAWLAHRQREVLDNLIFAPRGSANECLPTLVCLRANLLDQTSFQDAYKHLRHQEILYAEFLLNLRSKPKLLAYCLMLADRNGHEKISAILSTVFSGLYGSCVLAEDERLLLRLLHHLMRLQLSTSTNPRKLLRQGNCAFTRLYKSFSEELFSAKLFLTSALHDPILKLLSDDEVFLDVDPSKVIIRFPTSERERRFGKEGSPEYERKVKQHRAMICSKLEQLTNYFIRGIKENLHCFPPSLARLLKAMYNMLMANKVEPRLVNAVCVDVLFSLFICPAIVDPNPVGIIDTPISYVARSNLMQVAQILQVLALWKWEEIDPRLMDLYSRFDKDTLGTVLEAILDLGSDAYLLVGMTNNSNNSMPPEDDMDLELTYFDDALASLESGGDMSHHSTRLSRLAVLVTVDELADLIHMLRSVQGHAELSEVDASELITLLDPLPPKMPAFMVNKGKDQKNIHSTPNEAKDGNGENSAIAAMIAKRQVLSNKLSTAVNAAVRRSSSVTASTPSTPGSDEVPNSTDIGISPVPSTMTNSLQNDSLGATNGDSFDESTMLQQCEPEMVLVVPFPDRHTGELPGFLSEDHVISRSRQAARVVRMNLANLPGGDGVVEDHDGAQGNARRNSHGNATVNSEENSSLVSVGPTGEKRTRFSLSHDEGSIGNTSDNLEAISEAASNHSVASSLEDEPDNPDAEDPINDNLSDMVSANVSGRGTPNVSGRDTPSSQVTEDGADDSHNRQPRNEENNEGHHQNPQIEIDNRPAGGHQVAGVAGAALHVANRMQRGRKSGEPDLDEKFGKFEIKPPPRTSGAPHHVNVHPGGHVVNEQGDETISMVSDTWSTDVLASDTETTMGEGDDRHSRRNRVRLPDDLQLSGVDRQFSGTSSTQGGVSGASSSAANLLDVAETASEAWSIDVLASDTESLRLAELDNEDTSSVARSDDTTRSDPAELLLVNDGASGLKNRMFPGDGAMRQSRADVVEQWARQSSGHAQRLSSGSSIHRRGSDSLGSRPAMEGNSILKKPQSIPESSDMANGAPRLLSHPSAASIASSTESSAGESGAGGATKEPANNNKASLSQGEIEVVSAPASATPVSSAASNALPNALPKKPTLAMSNTGAIPKSISFDKTVVMNNNSRHTTKDESPVSSSSELDPNVRFDAPHIGLAHKQRGDKSFFKSWKLPKIGRHRGGGHSSGYKNAGNGSGERGEQLLSSNSDEMLPTDIMSRGITSNQGEAAGAADEVSADEILAKYRSKPRVTEAELSTSNEVILSAPFTTAAATAAGPSNDLVDGEDIDDRLVVDPHNIEASYAFQDAKRKLRMMLSEADLSLLTTSLPSSSSSTVVRDLKATNDLVALLKVQLAEAHNLQDRNMVAQLHETLRCLSLFDNEACRKLVRSLKEDYKRRSPYLAYLVKCRQGLLATLAHQRRLLSRLDADRRVCSAHQLSVCIRLFLEKREKQMSNFVTNFRESCSAADEKIALMERFLASLWSQLEADTSVTLLTGNSPSKIDTCRVAVERAVVAHIYYHAMYPNGEADVSRDVVLAEHIAKLAGEISPNHRDLRIGKQYHYEAPWPSAQAELGQLAAFKTPKDKVACVVRCCQTIMNLLSISAKSNVPAADDFLPVLVFVVVKANPPSLLSTVQYVESFYGNRLSGEDHYWWMQFVAAIEFIKTMDYSASSNG